ncbi:hypothetical protein ACFPU0_13535 [Pseudomonas sp. GCM10022186]|uniref:hypothetical protein n=1 Tax=Pseudomonas sp. GCM10022186 TaxID=3252650 RepID=UPI000FB86C58
MRTGRARIRQDMTPRELAREAFAGIEAEHCWLLPHKNFKPALQRRLASILDGTKPVLQMADV